MCRRRRYDHLIGMTRLLFHILSVVLTLSLILGTGVGGYKRMSHAMASAGMTEIVICSSDGASAIQLDRNGNEVDAGSTGICAHCADCSLVPIVAFLDRDSTSGVASDAADKFIALTVLPAPISRVEHPSRGPPIISKV